LAEIVLAPRRNPPEGQPGGPAHRELWIRDPDGYTVVLASPDGEAGLRRYLTITLPFMPLSACSEQTYR
jgi:hypothetical protein